MNKQHFYIIIAMSLLLSNCILFYLLTKKQQDNDGPKKIIVEKLHLDSTQISKYDACIERHRKSINENETKLNELRCNLFNQLKNTQDSAVIDSIILLIAKHQCNAEKINYKHFFEIKKICTPSQQKDFNELTSEIANLFSLKERN